jgi:hypothetical protein
MGGVIAILRFSDFPQTYVAVLHAEPWSLITFASDARLID